jgi:hypothetical protein
MRCTGEAGASRTGLSRCCVRAAAPTLGQSRIACIMTNIFRYSSSPPVNDPVFPALPGVSTGFLAAPGAGEYYAAPAIT